MMEYTRLTERAENGEPYFDGCLTCDFERDCGLCPYWVSGIRQLAELEDKIEQGTLKELPCKVGDTVYIVYAFSGILEWEVDEIVIMRKNILFRLTYKGTKDHNFALLSEKGKTLTKHDKTNTRLFRVWNNIKRRCYTKTDPSYKYYGERGIKICNDWLSSFQSFYDWAYANGYDENAKKGQCTIDRINVNGNYEPSNCRWVSMKEQSKNKRNTVYGKG